MMKILYFYLSGLLLLWSSCQRPTMLDFALRYAGETAWNWKRYSTTTGMIR